MHKKLGEDRTCSSKDMIADKHKHTDTHTHARTQTHPLNTRLRSCFLYNLHQLQISNLLISIIVHVDQLFVMCWNRQVARSVVQRTAGAPESLGEGAGRVLGAVALAGVVRMAELVLRRGAAEQRRQSRPVPRRCMYQQATQLTPTRQTRQDRRAWLSTAAATQA